MTYYIVQTAPRGEYIVCWKKPKHLYSRKTYIYMWRTINRQKKKPRKKTQNCLISPRNKQKKIKHNKDTK